ncbi:hypothetical protein SLEP1_g53590 [Rubroshorea leprosula]|uniref:NB-ARC domain-containing protein n=1 Tax=Rubroshorea leprosula TaxID=152421 RepID=A0AAV5MCM9_9ROSI|nr:hypothetical protein SLEP1_g53590 [Rubroshorea leprosula]
MDGIGPVMAIGKDVAPTVKKYVKYQICHNTYVNEFKEMQTKLKRRGKDVADELHTQLRPRGKIAKQEVEAWLKDAEQATAEKVVEDLICKGGCFTYICSSRKLDKKTQSLNERIFMQGEKYTDAGAILVVDDHSIKGFPFLVDNCSGRNDIIDQILTWLKGDEVTRIVVSGRGGVGKTTIMKHVHNQLLKEPKFSKVIWVEGSKDIDIIVQHKKKFDILKFQKMIASSLGLEPKDNENETDLAKLIAQKLQQGSFLLIVDDVREPFSLNEVGIPNLAGNNGCKLVLTTRLQNIAREMDCQACQAIEVDPLPDKEASALFLEKVGSDVFSNDGKSKREIEPILKQILQKCKGLPLAIVTVAISMKGKSLPRHWKLALLEFGESESIVNCLKVSYERMELLPHQQCFLCCALYPEDYEISKEELIEYWIEEELIYKEEYTREAMNWKGQEILDKLVENYLLELGKKESSVSMHCLVRDMALKINPEFLVKSGMALEKLPEECDWREDLLKVSLMRNNITEIPSSVPSPKCPRLTTLLLSYNKISTIPEAFFQHMLELKILDLSYNPELSRLPSSMSKLKKLTTLLLRDCESLREVPSLSNLVGLKKLDLSWTSIEDLPQGLNMLTNLKYLGLGGRLSETLDALLQNLSKLQHLIVNTKTKFQWEMIGSWGKLQNLEKLDLWNLDNLNAVFGEIGSIAQSALLPTGTFSSLQYISVFYCDKIKRLFSVRWLKYLQELQTIDVGYCKQLEELIGSESEEGEQVTLPKLESLKLTQLPQLKSIYSRSLICNSINKIEIFHCKNMESIFCSGFNPLPNLEYLHLSYLENLKSVFDEEGLGSLEPPTSFSLKEISVYMCNKLKKVFSSGWLLSYFESIQTIQVQLCSQMEELISSSAHEEGKVTLPKLERLGLTRLPALKSICSDSSFLICNSIQSLRISSCEKLKRIPLNFPLLNNGQSSCHPSLKEIVVLPEGCWDSLEWDDPNAKNIFLQFCEYQKKL